MWNHSPFHRSTTTACFFYFSSQPVWQKKGSPGIGKDLWLISIGSICGTYILPKSHWTSYFISVCGIMRGTDITCLVANKDESLMFWKSECLWKMVEAVYYPACSIIRQCMNQEIIWYKKEKKKGGDRARKWKANCSTPKSTSKDGFGATGDTY